MDNTMATRQNAYFGLGWFLSVILTIIPVTNIIFGVIIRFSRGKVLGGILNIILAPIFYVIDLITVIFSKDIILAA